ncbi:MAG: HDOD domain-containing protein [Bacteroidota bacterium]
MQRIQNLKEKVQTIVRLPALPAISTEVVKLVSNPRTSAASLAHLVSKDQVLTARLLKVANSPLYGFPRRISTIDFAIIVVGFNTFKEIIISASLLDSIHKRNTHSFDPQAFWDHAAATGAAARKFSHEFNYRLSGEAYVAGLLHDIGIIIEEQFFPREFREVIQLMRTHNVSHIDAEKKIFGVTHADIGSWLAARWNFPEQLVEAIRYHHFPEKAKRNPELVALIHCVDVLSTRCHGGRSEFDSLITISPDVLRILHRKEKLPLEEFMTSYTMKFRESFEPTTPLSNPV